MNRRTVGIVIATLGAVMLLVGIAMLAYGAGRGVRAVETVDQTIEDAIDVVTGEGNYTVAGEVSIQTIRSLASLTTVEMVEYTMVEKGDDTGLLNWATGEKLEMFVLAEIGAGIDLQAIEEDDLIADPEVGRVIIKLPPAEVAYVAVDNEASHVYNRETGVFTKGDPDLERAARLAAEQILLQNAYDNDILTLAEERAELVIEDLLTSLGYTDIEVVLTPASPPGSPGS